MAIATTQTWTATAAGTSLNLISCSITTDETWAPYIQGTLTCALPADPAVLDPRLSARVLIVVTDTPLTGTPLTYSYDLGVRIRTIQPDGTVTVTLASDEALMQDYGINGDYGDNSGSLRSALNLWLSFFFNTALQPDTSADYATGGWIIPNSDGGNIWETVAPYLTIAGLRLWVDGGRYWHLTVAPTPAAGNIALSRLATVTETSASISREQDDWYDSVCIRYTIPGAPAGADFAPNPGTWTKTKVLEYTVAAMPAFGAAQRLLNRTLARGRSQTLTAVTDFTAHPGITATVTNEDNTTQTGVVTAVTFNYPGDEMTVKLRDLTNP